MDEVWFELVRLGCVIVFAGVGVNFARLRSSGLRSGVLEGRVVLERERDVFGFRINVALYRAAALGFLIGAAVLAAAPL